jgi:hypothetical protein
MKILAIFFVLISFNLFKIVYNDSTDSGPVIEYPTLNLPEFNPIDVSGGCGGFVDCIEYVGAVLYNLALGIIFVVEFLIRIFVYIFQLIILVVQQTFTGIEGAPLVINVLITLPYAAGIGFIIYKLVRSGESED